MTQSTDKLLIIFFEEEPYVEYKVGDRFLKIVTKLSNKADKLFDKYKGPFIVKKENLPENL